MRRHFNDRGELYAVTLTHSEWEAFETGFRSADGEEPSILTWCPTQGPIAVRAHIVPFGDPAAAPAEFVAAAGVRPIAYRSAASAAAAAALAPAPATEEAAHVDSTT